MILQLPDSKAFNLQFGPLLFLLFGQQFAIEGVVLDGIRPRKRGGIKTGQSDLWDYDTT